ncbi:hypothetical protein MTATph1_CDS0220 [Moorella phage MTATph1]
MAGQASWFNIFPASSRTNCLACSRRVNCVVVIDILFGHLHKICIIEFQNHFIALGFYIPAYTVFSV